MFNTALGLLGLFQTRVTCLKIVRSIRSDAIRLSHRQLFFKHFELPNIFFCGEVVIPVALPVCPRLVKTLRTRYDSDFVETDAAAFRTLVVS